MALSCAGGMPTPPSRCLRRSASGRDSATSSPTASARRPSASGPARSPSRWRSAARSCRCTTPSSTPDYFTAYKLDPTPARHTQWDDSARPGWNAGNPCPGEGAGGGRGRVPQGRCRVPARGQQHRPLLLRHDVRPQRPDPRVDQRRNRLGHDARRAAEGRRADRQPAHGLRGPRREQPGQAQGARPAHRRPAPEAGPHAGFSLDTETLQREFLAACDWDQETCKPSRAKLEELGLADVAKVIHG